MRFQWIDSQRERFSLANLCRVMNVTRSGYYQWQKRQENPSASQLRRKELLGRIKLAYDDGRGLYGSPRIHAALMEQGISTCLNTVARLMKEARIKAVTARRFRVLTTDSNHDYRPAVNLLERDFTATGPNQKWLCDITYVPTGEGTLYLASVLDVFSRRIVGWSMQKHLKAELCMEALEMALKARRPGRDLVHHSDRGVQYACDAYQELLAAHGITCSMSRRGNCYDNAMMESYHGTVKTELVYQQPNQRFASIEQAKQRLFEYIEVFYNRQRRHSAIGYISPEAFEAALN